MSTSVLRDSKVWKISFREDEKAFLDAYADKTARTLRQLVDDAIHWTLDRWAPEKLSAFVLTSPGSKRCSVRIDSELFDQLQHNTSQDFVVGAGSPINAASILATAVWSYLAENISHEEQAKLSRLINGQLRVALPRAGIPLAS